MQIPSGELRKRRTRRGTLKECIHTLGFLGAFLLSLFQIKQQLETSTAQKPQDSDRNYRHVFQLWKRRQSDVPSRCFQSEQLGTSFTVSRSSATSLTIPKATGGKDMSSGGFATRAQSAAAGHANATAQQGGNDKASSGKK